MDVSGKWYNELKSEMEIWVEDGVLKGNYESKVGTAKGLYQMIGTIDDSSDDNVVIGWVVVWKNDEQNLHAVTTWSGEVQNVSKQGLTINTTWLLTSETNVKDDWKSTLIGKDVFTRSPRLVNSQPNAQNFGSYQSSL